jgi:putative flavoprotein involved in K+ transport
MDAVRDGPAQQVTEWLSKFGDALARGDIAAAVDLFDADSYWRDLVSFTWNIKTLEGKAEIAAVLAATLPDIRPSCWEIEGTPVFDAGVTRSNFTFETMHARGRGIIRLKGDKCWTLLTTLAELKGFEEKKGPTRALGTQHGSFKHRKSWLELKTQAEAELGFTRQPYCVIVGGGQGAIALAARLKRLDVPTIVVEKNERAGDSWRKRYKSLCLHDPVWYDHMPYLPFPDDWPVYSPKDKMGDWLEMYTRVLELNYWTSSEFRAACYDEEKQEWAVTVDRNGQTVVLRPKQLVLATGMSGIPVVPDIPGAGAFNGEQHHSSQHPGGESYRGRKCVVLGSNNSAHDICADLWEHDADVTMIQRSSTLVAKSDTLAELGSKPLYSEGAVRAGITTEQADLITASMPYRLAHIGGMAVVREMKKKDADLYARLERAGFMLDFGEDGSGLGMKYLRRGSGYYIDVGASDLIASGEIKLRSGVTITQIKEHSVVLSDGAELPADLIVYATGYGSMNGWAAGLISQAVADKVGKCWGLGSGTTNDPGPWEGELRNMWKPTAQPGLWFQGGNLHQARHYSQFLALQLKARMEGIPTPVYGMGQTHHLK